MPTTAIKSETSLLLKVSLPHRRLWNCTVLAHQCEEQVVVNATDLSKSSYKKMISFDIIDLAYTYVGTHDIQNISVSSPQLGEVRVTGDFINGTTATGVLAVIISESEIFYHFVERGNNEQYFDNTIQSAASGEHSISFFVVSFFVVEESGLPFSRTASMPKVVTIENGKSMAIVFTCYSDVQHSFNWYCATFVLTYR